MENKKISMHLKCLLTDQEKLQCGEDLANATNELNVIEADKKRINDDFKSKTSAAEAEVATLSNKLRSGYEFRDVPCEISFDDPEPGKKTVFRLDFPHDLAQVEVREMTDDEIVKSLQHELPLEPSPENFRGGGEERGAQSENEEVQ